jgi:dephospho-CoA kinase
MLKIGLTGGIGCGKSTVAALFTDYNTPVIDADVIAHQLTQSGQKAVAEIAQAFGTVIMNADGSLNRAQLRELIFSDAAKKHQLEAILHPLIFTQMQAQVDLLDSAYCIICIPLLIEKHRMDFVDRVLVVDCPESLQLERVKRRDHLTLAQIQSIIAAQTTRTQRLRVADEIIDNSKPAVQLAEQVKKLHNLYLNLSST